MADLSRHWQLDPAIEFLNHGSFGACPGKVLEAQQEIRREIEREPVEFFVRRFAEKLDRARERLAAFLGADPEGLVTVSNATTGVNAVLRSRRFSPGEELLVTDHAYNACRNAVEFVASRSGLRVVVASVPFPIAGPDEALEAILGAATPRTTLALIDHVTSQTGLILPLKAIVEGLADRGIDTLVDGAHAPGMLPLGVEEIGAAYYAGNCHKWLCAPKGAGFLWVRSDFRDQVRPLTISHGANTHRQGRSRLHNEFDWMGTDDPSAFLSVPTSIEFLESLVPGGWPEIIRRNHELALAGRRILADALDVEPPCPDEMIGSLAALPLPDGSSEPPESPLYTDPLQETLFREHRIEVPVVPWPVPPKRLLRISAQLYNREEQYERLGAALRLERSA